MAEAVRKVSQQTIMVPKQIDVSTINLHLTVEEAITLATLTANIAGALESSPRRHTGEILRALNKAGIRWISEGIQSGSIYFSDSAYEQIAAEAKKFQGV